MDGMVADRLLYSVVGVRVVQLNCVEFKLKCSAWHIVKWECAVGWSFLTVH